MISKIQKLIETLNIYKEDGLNFADFDVEKLYKTVIPQERSVVMPKDRQQFQKFLDSLDVKTAEELTAVRNTIVKYCADRSAEMRPEQEKLSAEFHAKYPEKTYNDFMEQNPYDIMWDQMSNFTCIIDGLIEEM